MAYDPEQRRKNMLQREYNANGQLISKIIPSHLHGRPTGYILYGCHCDTCNDWARGYRKELFDSRVHNQMIINKIMEATRSPQLPERKRRRLHSAPEPRIGLESLESLEPLEPEPVEPMSAVAYMQTAAPAPVNFAERVAEIQADLDEKLGEANNALRDALKVAPQREALTPPPVIPAVRERITTVDALRSISNAYYSPEWTAPLEMGRERRVFGTMEVIVDPNGNSPVIAFREREVAEGRPELLVEKKPTKKVNNKTSKGEGNRVKITDAKSLLAALKAAGCTVKHTGSGHLKVGKDGRYVTIPATASDHRAIPNALSDARKQGLL